MSEEIAGESVKERKSGQQIGKENVERVHTYVEEITRRGERIPIRNGRPNWTAIALTCGFSRGVFYDNDNARAVIERAIEHEAVNLVSTSKPETIADNGREAHTQKRLSDSERRVQRLEEQLAVKSAENEALRRDNNELKEQLRKFAAFEEVMVASGKRYIP